MFFIEAWLCPVCNKPALYTDLFIDQFFIDFINQCPPNVRAIEYEINGQWKAIDEEKLSRKAQRERDAQKTETTNNGRASFDMNQSMNHDQYQDQTRTREF